jgi:hypothetical protein
MVLGSYARHIKTTCLCVDTWWGGGGEYFTLLCELQHSWSEVIGKETAVTWRHCVMVFDGPAEIRTTFLQKYGLIGDFGHPVTSYVL